MMMKAVGWRQLATSSTLDPSSSQHLLPLLPHRIPVYNAPIRYASTLHANSLAAVRRLEPSSPHPTLLSMRTSATLGADLVRLSAACQMISNSGGRIACRLLLFCGPICCVHCPARVRRLSTCQRRCAVDDDDDSEAMVGGDALRLLYAHGLFVASRSWYADIHSLWRVET